MLSWMEVGEYNVANTGVYGKVLPFCYLSTCERSESVLHLHFGRLDCHNLVDTGRRLTLLMKDKVYYSQLWQNPQEPHI